MPPGNRRLHGVQPVAAKRREPEAKQREVKYGNDWYEATRERPRTVKEEIGEPHPLTPVRQPAYAVTEGEAALCAVLAVVCR